ncbi:MAG: biosynthetic-type acetolactate synthase large subunit [Bacteroidia bacterium]|nr:biosynthetic-type acetolactate synthase large subunit [Bacteroidia bacterium]
MQSSPQALSAIPPEKRIVSGSEAVILSLLEENVDTIFGYPGGAIMPVYDALYDFQDQIRHILMRHEQGATHAAQGYSRVTRKVGVCLATSGPGATNLVTGIADAMMDSTPMVCITGQVASHLLGTDAFQETDVISMTIGITKWNYQVTRAEEIPLAIAKAFFIANSGRPGPVIIDICKDALLGSTEFEYEHVTKVGAYTPLPVASKQNLQEAADLLNTAQRPYCLLGHGVMIAGAQDLFKEFIEKTGIPVGSTMQGLSALPSDHPLHTGMLGMHGNYGPNILSNKADVVIAIGMRFDDRVTGDVKRYLTDAQVIHVEIDPAEIDKNIMADVALLGDAADVLRELIPMVEKRSHPEWRKLFHDADKVEYEKVIQHDIHAQGEFVRMAEVVHQLSEKTKGEATVVTDVGQHQMATARYYKFRETDAWVSSGGLGTMGYAVPAAFGAAIARQDRPVLCFVGDGAFQMTLQELTVLAYEKTPVKIILLNNGFLGMVRQWQELFFEGRYSFVHMHNPDFVAVGKAFGLEAERVDTRAQLSDAIDRMLAHEGPFLLEIKVEQEGNIFPMIPSGCSVDEVILEPKH